MEINLKSRYYVWFFSDIFVDISDSVFIGASTIGSSNNLQMLALPLHQHPTPDLLLTLPVLLRQAEQPPLPEPDLPPDRPQPSFLTQQPRNHDLQLYSDPQAQTRRKETGC